MRELAAIRAVNDRTGRVELLFSDGKHMKVASSVLADLGLYQGMEIPDEALAAIEETAARANTRARAVRIITATNVSERELRRRLVQKGETEAHADDAVTWLSELHLVDDAATARQIAQRAARKGYGVSRIRMELRQKGIPQELWEDAMADLPEPDDAIDSFLQARLRGQEPDEKELRRVTDALARRGHSWSDIKAGLSRYRERLEEEM